MKSAIKKAWIKALRSGEYKQGSGSLINEHDDKITGWCCLGVLCNLPRVPGEWRGDDYWYGRSHDDTQLSSNLRKTVGVSEAEMNTLIDLNDSGKSFKHIAKWIEENL